LDCCEKIGDFVGGEVGEVGHGSERAYEDVTWEEGFEVYETEG
jgi:hypothetical protein